MTTPRSSSSPLRSPRPNSAATSTPRFSAGAQRRFVFYDARIMVLAIHPVSFHDFDDGCCGTNAIGDTVDNPSRAWLALAVMFVVVLRSSLICHTPVISAEASIETLISGSYCSTGDTTPSPTPGRQNKDEHATCLHCASRRRINASSVGESV